MADVLNNPFTLTIALAEAQRKHCDLIALCLNARAQVSGDEDVVFFNQAQHPRFRIRVDAATQSLHIDPQQFPATGTVLVLAALEPPLAAGSKPIPMRLTSRGIQKEWTFAANAEVIEICSFTSQAPGQIAIRRRDTRYQQSLAEVLHHFGVNVNEASPPSQEQALLQQATLLPSVRQQLAFTARLTPTTDKDARLRPSLACSYLTNSKHSGIAWAWDEDLWQLPQTPVYWQREQDRQIISLGAEHIPELQRLWIFLHTPYPQTELDRSLNDCSVAVDGKPLYRLNAASGRGRVLLLARLERQPDGLHLFPDHLLAADLATLAERRQIPLAPIPS